jgi:hypothetical protein
VETIMPDHAREARVTILAICTLFAAACSQPNIKGRVSDAVGTPIQGAKVTIEDSGYMAVTDTGGNYELRYTPGTFSVRYEKEGCSHEVVKRTLLTSDNFPAAPVTLLPEVAEGQIVCITKTDIVEITAVPPSAVGGSRVLSEEAVLGSSPRRSRSGVELKAPYHLAAGEVTCLNGRGRPLQLTITKQMAAKITRVSPVLGSPWMVDYDEPVPTKSLTVGTAGIPAYRVLLAPDSRYAWSDQPSQSGGQIPLGRFNFDTY